MIAGVKFRAIPAERGTWSLSGERVREEIINAKREGFIPFFITATLGTTPTCAVDDLKGIAETCKDFPEIWLHVDAAVPLRPLPSSPPTSASEYLFVVRC
jgi:aromatic-L-amino-acid decarboxylase